jgi:DNA-directed RNA polymerase sigma subunit (sigma70/sigma32)
MKTRLRKAAALKDYLKLVARLPRLDAEGRAALAARREAGDAAAAVALFESWLPMVVAEAALHRGLGLPFADLIAAGNRAVAAVLQRHSSPDEVQMRQAIRAVLREVLARQAVRRAG